MGYAFEPKGCTIPLVVKADRLAGRWSIETDRLAFLYENTIRELYYTHVLQEEVERECGRLDSRWLV